MAAKTLSSPPHGLDPEEGKALIVGGLPNAELAEGGSDSSHDKAVTSAPANVAPANAPPNGNNNALLGVSTSIIVGIIAYSLCSASLLLLNKVAVTYLPSVSFVLFCQFVSSITVVKGCGMLGLLEVDALSVEKVKKFWGVSFLFACCLFTNVKALQYANVETLIVFRSLSPIAVAIMDFVFLDMELPSRRSALALLSIVAGAVAYVAVDGNFKLDSYLWVTAYFISIVAEMVYVKFIITECKMTTWGRVYYNNLLSIFPTLVFGYIFNDHIALRDHEWTPESIIFLALSCAVGVGISYAGFFLRALISATSFTVVGVVNKIATTAVNLLVWDKHANVYGIAALMFCIVGGTFYQQSEKKRGQTG